jgi:esterase/lipase
MRYKRIYIGGLSMGKGIALLLHLGNGLLNLEQVK